MLPKHTHLMFLFFSDHSEKSKSKPRVAFDPDEVKKDERKIEEETRSRLETMGRLAEERKLLESQMDLERRRLEREQEALKKDSEKLEAEKKKFEEEKRKQVIFIMEIGLNPSAETRVTYYPSNKIHWDGA